MNAIRTFFASLFSAAPTREETNPAPSAAMTMDEAITIGIMWETMKPDIRTISRVLATGSMLPLFGSKSLLLLEKVTADQLHVNDIALYDRAGMLVSHRVKEVRPDGILFDGDNNRTSDGWVDPKAIRWRVAGILYTSGE